MNVKSKTALAVGAGFVVGAVMGFMYSKQVKSTIGQHVKTDFSAGVVTVRYDAAGNLAAGLPF